jgi:formylglycine-generating enzyme required for sulfatase activity
LTAYALVVLLTPGCRATADWIEPTTGMVFVRLPSAALGAAASPPLWIGKFEVTQAEWEAVMDRDNAAWFHDDSGRLPMENVTWFEVRDFLSRLNSRSPGARFRLPTEREWETACRAGTTTTYSTGETLRPDQANFAASPERMSEGRTMRVGSFPANPLGLHDMHGNVWEWTADAAGDGLMIIRGGSWYFGADSAACGLRYTHRPQDRGFSIGFRVVRDE